MSVIKNRRMDAYYYQFDQTGVDWVDKILSAVACAGKSFHHTDMWRDEEWPNGDCWNHEGHSGKSCIEMIQNAANEAAKEIEKLVDDQLALISKIKPEVFSTD